jgi:hypothetical protein
MFEKVDHFSNITWTKFHLTNTTPKLSSLKGKEFKDYIDDLTKDL